MRADSVSGPAYQHSSGRTAGFESERDRKNAERAQDILPLLQPGARVLEIGCAEGSLGGYVKSRTDVRWEGIEVSLDAAPAATLLDAVHRDPLEKLRLGDFDAILSFHVLEHIRDVASHVRAIRHALRPSGWLMIEVPHERGHPAFHEDPNLEHIHAFSVASIDRLLTRGGFRTTRVTRGHFESPTFPESTRILARHEPTKRRRSEAVASAFATLNQHSPDGVVVVGLGGDYRGYVRGNLRSFNCVGLSDSNPQHTGQWVDGFCVSHPHEAVVLFPTSTFLLASHRFRNELRESLVGRGIRPVLIIDIASVLELASQLLSSEEETHR